jgi:hypothetical protein
MFRAYHRRVSLGNRAARWRRAAAPAACLLLLALALSGCASSGASLRASEALQSAGYQNGNVVVTNGDGAPSGILITVVYSRGPTGNDQRDAQRAEQIFWDNYAGGFGSLQVFMAPGACSGSVCGTRADVIAGASYAQLAARFGSKPIIASR